ncbi:MAG: ATP-binding protein [Candidatus Nitrosocosmicus sp.]
MAKSDNSFLPSGGGGSGDEITEIIYDLKTAISCGVKFIQNAKGKMDILCDKSGPSLILKYDIYKDNYAAAKKRGVKIRFITEITNDNIHYCKELKEFVSELRHLDGLKGTISVNELEFIGTTTWSENHLLNPAIYSNSKQVVEQQQYIFDTFWKKASPAEQKILEIDEGIEPEVMETSFSNTNDIQDKVFSILNSANMEILVLFATSNAFHRQANGGSFKKLIEVTKRKPWMSVKILTPKDKVIEKIIDDLYAFNLNVRIIEPISQVSILIVDRKHALVAELKEDSRQILTEQTTGFVTYSNSPPTVLTYSSIFDSLWTQTEMYKQLQVQDKIQKEFINTAAHELRTPIQPIIGMVDLIKKDIKNEKYLEFLEVISRNAKRLKKLSEDILDTTRIENNFFSPIKEYFELNQVIIDTINSLKNEINNKSIKIEYILYKNIRIYADKAGINRVLSNLVGNSIKFNPQGGNINIDVEKKEISSVKEKNDIHKNKKIEIIIISVKDTGTGIQQEIFPNLFAKFTTTSFQGIGLGLFISKNIVEAHGGKIWAKNNKDGKGATFSFSLPLTSSS